VSIMVNNGFRKRRTMRWRTFLAPRMPCKPKRYPAKDFFTCSILENSGKRGIRILLKKCRFGLTTSNRPVSLKKFKDKFMFFLCLKVFKLTMPKLTICFETEISP
jgi:hypothetical protein